MKRKFKGDYHGIASYSDNGLILINQTRVHELQIYLQEIMGPLFNKTQATVHPSDLSSSASNTFVFVVVSRTYHSTSISISSHGNNINYGLHSIHIKPIDYPEDASHPGYKNTDDTKPNISIREWVYILKKRLPKEMGHNVDLPDRYTKEPAIIDRIIAGLTDRP